MDNSNKLYQDLEEIEDKIKSLGAEADLHYCPDWCSGGGSCQKCSLQDEIDELYKDAAGIRRQLGLEA